MPVYYTLHIKTTCIGLHIHLVQLWQLLLVFFLHILTCIFAYFYIKNVCIFACLYFAVQSPVRLADESFVWTSSVLYSHYKPRPTWGRRLTSADALHSAHFAVAHRLRRKIPAWGLRERRCAVSTYRLFSVNVRFFETNYTCTLQIPLA